MITLSASQVFKLNEMMMRVRVTGDEVMLERQTVEGSVIVKINQSRFMLDRDGSTTPMPAMLR